jgi:hypothetical protein
MQMFVYILIHKAGLANFNLQEGKIIRKTSPEGHTSIYTYK